MYCVALTGNIASGKSTVAKLFSKRGIDIINADQISRALTQPGEPAFSEILQYFGEAILTAHGELDRSKLRHIIFNDAEKRQWLESLLHPPIRQEIARKVSECNSPYCMIEIPLLPNRKHYPYLDEILYVDARREDQIERVMRRDHCSHEKALAILNIQASIEQHKSLADRILYNNGSLDDLEEQVDKLHQQYLKQAQAKTE
ncbi:dephospho-CoA kinase [Legionella impletisoli]|uniref:Dephospho-CoA kinase n=1 Tax=Legionella impletisoli TaxID=343510 RepID=A0A917JQ50_9GAMM|nr:dephospho-CoA kinase [Legionella impletisoli]GGI81362.1 dephospho-CoA kinase [Legionella impletisoli]